MRTLEEGEHARRLAGGAANRRIGGSVAREQAPASLKLLQCERRLRVADIELMHLAAAPHLAALESVEQLCVETEQNYKWPILFRSIAGRALRQYNCTVEKGSFGVV